MHSVVEGVLALALLDFEACLLVAFEWYQYLWLRLDHMENFRRFTKDILLAFVILLLVFSFLFKHLLSQAHFSGTLLRKALLP